MVGILTIVPLCGSSDKGATSTNYGMPFQVLTTVYHSYPGGGTSSQFHAYGLVANSLITYGVIFILVSLVRAQAIKTSVKHKWRYR